MASSFATPPPAAMTGGASVATPGSGGSPQRTSAGGRRLSRGQQQYSDPQTYPYAFHPRDDSLQAHVKRLVLLFFFSPLIVLNWVRRTAWS